MNTKPMIAVVASSILAALCGGCVAETKAPDELGATQQKVSSCSEERCVSNVYQTRSCSNALVDPFSGEMDCDTCSSWDTQGDCSESGMC